MYANVNDMVSRFGEAEMAQRSDLVAGTTLDAAVIGQALADATAEMDGYLATRYTLPLSPQPTVLNRTCCDIARYLLWGDNPLEMVRERYQNAIRMLEAVAKGHISLGMPTDDTPEPVTGGVTYHAAPRVFVAGAFPSIFR
ncbi:MAG: DUF1320 domain-containing protein [Magnetococcales bacterium]|nr:DUF1320 domain-containing protein [Magnetococcales bacterium]